MMFRPIKNFISYFQKNTSGKSTSIFDSTQSNVSDTEMERNIDPLSDENDENHTEIEFVSNSPQKSHDQNENEVTEELVIDSYITTNEKDSSCSNESTEETLIIDSLIDCCSVEIDTPEKVSICNPIETKDSTHVSPTKIFFDELCSVRGNKNINGKQFESEFAVDEEVIVISTNESNSFLMDSMSDPLAIDSGQVHTSNPIIELNDSNSSVIETTTDNGIVCIINVDNIKDSKNIAKGTKIVKNIGVLRNRSDFDISNIKIEVGSEEQELRSDGSDSGLGSETSTLQTSVSSNTDFVCESSIKEILPSKSSLKRRSNEEPIILEKKTKRSIHFDGVKVYYFPRIQGFTCVPSQGGCTLGMGSRHIHHKTFSLTDYAAEQRKVHKQQMQEINPRNSSTDESDSDEEVSEASGSDLDPDGSGFLQPVPARQRRALLKAAGIRKIDSDEKDDCRRIRTSREFCGCSCQGYCDPDTCSCSQSGIKCQVDRPSFPCGCTRDGCANVVGRVEFNPGRVRTHYIHTIMRLEIENKQKRRDEPDSTVSMPMLNYMNNCITNNSNLSITATLNTCSSSTNSLSNICNYSVSNAGHIGSQSYHLHLQQHNQGFVNNTHYTNMMHNTSVSQFSNENCAPSQVLHDSNQQQLIGSNCMRLMTNSSPAQMGSGLDICGINSNSNHSTDLSYPLRDISSENSLCNNLMIDFSSNNSQIFHHDLYSGQPYVPQSYQSQYVNSNNSYNLTAAAYSNYQQNFIPFLSQNCDNESIEIHDLTSPDENSSSYINLNPPLSNSSRLDAINDLLHNNRNTPPTAPTISPSSIIDPLPMKPATVSLSVACSLASSAQTSTSIVEGTSTKLSSVQSFSGRCDSSFVDLTKDLSEIENISPKISIEIQDKDVQIIEPLDILKDINTVEIDSLDVRSPLSKVDYDELIVAVDLEKENLKTQALNTDVDSNFALDENESNFEIERTEIVEESHNVNETIQRDPIKELFVNEPQLAQIEKSNNTKNMSSCTLPREDNKLISNSSNVGENQIENFTIIPDEKENEDLEDKSELKNESKAKETFEEIFSLFNEEASKLIKNGSDNIVEKKKNIDTINENDIEEIKEIPCHTNNIKSTEVLKKSPQEVHINSDKLNKNKELSSTSKNVSIANESIENDENLVNIIKKSIVETCSA